MGLEVTNRVNFVQFEAAFTSAEPSDGLLTVYWNTNNLGFVDERVNRGELRRYVFGLPGEYSSGVYTLSFQLDAPSERTASVMVTNLVLGFEGLSEPARLEITGMEAEGQPALKLTAPAPTTFLVETSTNLVNWEAYAWVVNTNGTVWFVPPPMTNANARFYRAVLR